MMPRTASSQPDSGWSEPPEAGPPRSRTLPLSGVELADLAAAMLEGLGQLVDRAAQLAQLVAALGRDGVRGRSLGSRSTADPRAVARLVREVPSKGQPPMPSGRFQAESPPATTASESSRRRPGWLSGRPRPRLWPPPRPAASHELEVRMELPHWPGDRRRWSGPPIGCATLDRPSSAVPLPERLPGLPGRSVTVRRRLADPGPGRVDLPSADAGRIVPQYSQRQEEHFVLAERREGLSRRQQCLAARQYIFETRWLSALAPTRRKHRSGRSASKTRMPPKLTVALFESSSVPMLTHLSAADQGWVGVEIGAISFIMGARSRGPNERVAGRNTSRRLGWAAGWR